MRKSEVEVKQRWKAVASQPQLSNSCKEIVNSNTKEHIKRVVCGATVFFCLWLHLDSQSFKTVWNFIYLPHPAALLLAAGGDVNKPCYLTSGSFLLFINNYR